MDFKTKPFPHQLDAFEKFKDSQIIAFNADMGTGKTKMAIDIIAHKFIECETVDRVLIIAPNGVHAQWTNEQFPEHCPVPYIDHTALSIKNLSYIRKEDQFIWHCKDNHLGLAVLSINIDSFARERGNDLAEQFLDSARMGTCVVVDEASIIKTPDIKTVRNVKKLRDRYEDGVRITMTGTPAAKGPVNMWSIFDFLREGYMGCSYIAFRMTHTVVYNKKLRVKGRLVTIQDDITQDFYNKVKPVIEGLKAQDKLDDYAIDDIKTKYGLSNANFWHIYNAKMFFKYKNLDRLHEKIKNDTFMIKKSECLELPPKIYKKEYVKLNQHQKKLINTLSKYAVATYEGEELTLEVKALLGLRVLQICGGFFAHHTDIEGKFGTTPVMGRNAKVDYIKSNLIEVGEAQAIIWAVYTDEVDLLYNTLSKEYSVGRLDGSVTGDDRISVVERFKQGKLQHLVAHPEVGGFGYNFQNATVQYWYSRNYRTEKRIQAEDRSHRIGTVQSPIYIDLLYDIDIENRVYDVVKEEALLNEMFLTSGTHRIDLPTSTVDNMLDSTNLKDIFKLK